MQAAARRGGMLDRKLVVRHAHFGELRILLQQGEEARVECCPDHALVVYLVTRVATSGCIRVDAYRQDLVQQRDV